MYYEILFLICVTNTVERNQYQHRENRVVVLRVHRKHRVKVLIHRKHVIWLIVTYSANTQNTLGSNTYADADKNNNKNKVIWDGSTSPEKYRVTLTVLTQRKKWGDIIIQKNSNKNNPQVTEVLLLNYYNITRSNLKNNNRVVLVLIQKNIHRVMEVIVLFSNTEKKEREKGCTDNTITSNTKTVLNIQ